MMLFSIKIKNSHFLSRLQLIGKRKMEFASFMTQQIDKYVIPFAINSEDKIYDYQAENWIPIYKDLLNGIFM